MEALSLMATLGLDSSDFEKGLSDSSSEAHSFASTIGDVMRSAINAVGEVISTIGDLGKKFVNAASEVAQYGDSIDKTSQKFGLSAQSYQEWDFILQHSGSSISAMRTGMRQLSSAVASGSDAFQKLGISQEDVASMSQEELFSATISALQNIEDETQRTAIATELFGRSAQELGPLLNTSSEDTEAMRQRVHDLGGVMSDEAVKASARYQDSLQDLQYSLSGIKNNMMANFLPGMSTVMDGLADLFSGSGSGTAKIVEGIYSVVDNMRDLAPKLAKRIKTTIKQIMPAVKIALKAVVDIIGDLLPVIMDAITEIMPVIADALPGIITTVLPSLMSALGQLIASVVTNLPAILSALWSGLTSALSAIWTSLVDQYPILGEIAEKLGGFFSNAWEAVKTAWSGITEFFTGLWNDLTTNPTIIGIGDAFLGFFSGAYENIKLLWNGITEFFQTLWGLIKGDISLSDAVDQIENSFSTIYESITGLWDDVVTFFEGLWTSISEEPALSGLMNIIKEPFEKAWNGIKEVWNGITTFFETIWGYFSGELSPEEALEGVKSAFTQVWDGIKSYWDGVTTYFSNIWDAIKTNETMIALGDAIKKPFVDAWSSIEETWENVKQWFEEIWNSITDGTAFSALLETITKPFSDAWDAISGLFSGIGEWFEARWNEITDSPVFQAIQAALSAPFEFVQGAIQNVIDKVQEAIDKIKEFFGLNNRGPKLESASDKVGKNVGNATKTAVLDGITAAAVDGAQSIVYSMYDSDLDDAIRDKIMSGFLTAKIPKLIVQAQMVLNGPTNAEKIWDGHENIWDKHASAMDSGEILNGLTPFGIDSNGVVHYGGEAGPEAVVGVNSLNEMIQRSVNAAMANVQPMRQPINVQLLLDSGELLAAVDVGLNDRANWRGGGRA